MKSAEKPAGGVKPATDKVQQPSPGEKTVTRPPNKMAGAPANKMAGGYKTK